MFRAPRAVSVLRRVVPMMADLLFSPIFRRGIATVVLVAGAFTGMVTSAASEVDLRLGPTERPAAYTHQIRPVEGAIERLGDAEQESELIRAATESVLIDYRDLSAQQAQLSATAASTVEQVADARRDARSLSVDAFISGGSMSNTSALIASVDANDFAWRNYLLIQQSLARVRAATRLEALRVSSSAELYDLGHRVENVADRLAIVEEDSDRARSAVAIAETELIIARAWRRAHAAAEEGAHPVVSDKAWAALRHCESRGRYTSVSPSGTYRGAYQFDVSTWISVGGVGDPIDATPEEQDARARILFAERGQAPWPNCGPATLP